MARKSNKTSHVLHLLAGEEPVPEPSEKDKKDTPADTDDKDTDQGNAGKNDTDKEANPGPAQGPAETAAAQNGPHIPIISTGRTGDDPVADLIRGQLEEEFPEDILAPQRTDQGDDRLPDIPSLLDTPAANDAPHAAEDTAGSQMQTLSAENSALSDGSAPDGQQNAPDGAPVPTEDIPDGIIDAAPEEVPGDIPPDPAADSPADVQSDVLPDHPIDAPKDVRDDIAPALPADVPENIADSPDSDQSVHTDEAQEKPALAQQDLDPILHPQEQDEEPLQNYRFVNVMEYIVKDLVIDYMKKFGMCTCERCVVDTMALALTYCSAKYIVVDAHSVSPLLNYYSNKYLGDVTVELTKACIKIKDNPRH